MELLTKELKQKLPPLYSQEHVKDPVAVIKYFLGSWTWYIVEGEKQEEGDYLFFGLVIGLETELGYFRLSELQEIRGPLGLPVERDLYFSPKKISECK